MSYQVSISVNVTGSGSDLNDVRTYLTHDFPTFESALELSDSLRYHFAWRADGIHEKLADGKETD